MFNIIAFSNNKCILNVCAAGFNATFEVQVDEKPTSLTWLKDNKLLDDRLADRITAKELDGNYYQLNIMHCT